MHADSFLKQSNVKKKICLGYIALSKSSQFVYFIIEGHCKDCIIIGHYCIMNLCLLKAVTY